MKTTKKLVTLALCIAVMLCVGLSAAAIDLDTAETAEATTVQLLGNTVVPGVNAFTGSVAVKNFTEEDLLKLNLHGTTTAELWDGNKLRLNPLTSPFYTRIPMDVAIDRPALTITDIHAMNTMVKVNGVYIVGGGDAFGTDKILTNLKADSGENASYYEAGNVCITMEKVGGDCLNIFYNMAVIPYYKITYKNLLPDGTAGTDTIKYFLGTAEEKANIKNEATGITGLPTSYSIDSAVVLTTEGYTFEGWATDAEGEAVDTVTLANEDIILYPVWKETSDEPVELTLTPGVNALTGTTAVQNFTADDVAALVTTEGVAQRWPWDVDALRLSAPTPGASYYSSIKLPVYIDRPALTMTDLWIFEVQVMIGTGWWGTGWGEQKFLTNQHIDTGDGAPYNNDKIGIAVADLGGNNVAIFKNMAIVPYYQITYKNILPDGQAGGEDVIEYYLGTEEEKAAMTNDINGITGLPTSYTVENITLAAEGYVITGWTTEEGGEAVSTVALANEDIVLYPVWEEIELTLTPGVNAFTGTTAVKNFTKADLSSIVTTEGSAEIWTNNSLRLYPPTPGVYFDSAIKLPFTIDRPALTLTNLWLMSTQVVVNGAFYEGPWESDRTYNGVQIDTGADKAYGKDTVGITISDLYGTNINIFSNMAVIPYYQITYKNILPDGTTGEDVIKYYLGTDEEKANIKNEVSGLTGLPTSYAVEDVTLTADGYTLTGWSLTEGGEAVDAVALANEDIVLYPIWEYDSEVLTPVTQDTTEIRTSSPFGIRFKAEVSHKVRRIENEDVEYGFIVTTEHLIGEKELTFDSGVQYAQGKAYSTTENIDIVFAEGDAGVIFTGVLIGVPDNKDAYTTEFIARSYVKIGDTYFYGDTHTDSLYDAVSRVDESIVAEFPYLQNIIDTVEK